MTKRPRGNPRNLRKRRGWLQLAFVLALLPLSTPVDALTFLQIFRTDHPHALMTVVDGGHVDLVLSHVATRPAHEDGPGLHPKSAKDHVVHIEKDELAAAQKRDGAVAPAALRAPLPVVDPLPPTLRVPSRVAARVPASFSRRSVVLRT